MSEVKLQEGIIYMIDSYDPEIKGYYVGSTLNTFSQRRTKHKYCCNNNKCKSYNHYKYVYIRSNGGWNNFKMTIIDRVIVETEDELRIIEQDWIDTIKPNLNSHKAYATDDDRKIQKDKADKIYKSKHRLDINNKAKEIVQCDHCDITYTKRNKSQHQKSKYCINYISN